MIGLCLLLTDGHSDGGAFRRKEEEFEDDLEFKSKRPSNAFIAHSIVVYSADERQLTPASVRRARESLRLVCHSVDLVNDLQVGVLLAFAPSIRGYVLHHGALCALRRAFGVVIKRLISASLATPNKLTQPTTTIQTT